VHVEIQTAALELIVGVLTTYGGARFRALSEAAALMRGDLCASLLHHCTSDVTELVSLSLRVFVALVAGFKNHLKAEIEVFITSIFLRILESEHSVFEHKMLVVEVISELCRDPLALVEMFVNYDCDLQAIDLFKRIVTALAKVAKGCTLPDSAGKKEQEDARSLQMLGMKGIVDTVSSMVKAADLEILAGEMEMASRQTGGRKRLNSAESEEVSASGGVAIGSMQASPAAPAAAAAGIGDEVPTPTSGKNTAIMTNDGNPSDVDLGSAAPAEASPASSDPPSLASSAKVSLSAPLTVQPPPEEGGEKMEEEQEEQEEQEEKEVEPFRSSGPVTTSTRPDAALLRAAGMSAQEGEGSGGRTGAFGAGGIGSRDNFVRGAGGRFDGGQQQGEATQVFDKKRRVQRELEEGIVKFNQKPKEGLALLESKGHLDSKDPASVAAFLRAQADRLDKTEASVGEFMGRGIEYMEGFCVKVLHAYVDG
ncbi:unnamed protein product, partial [Sphacelaria rigidula]